MINAAGLALRIGPRTALANSIAHGNTKPTIINRSASATKAGALYDVHTTITVRDCGEMKKQSTNGITQCECTQRTTNTMECTTTVSESIVTNSHNNDRRPAAKGKLNRNDLAFLAIFANRICLTPAISL